MTTYETDGEHHDALWQTDEYKQAGVTPRLPPPTVYVSGVDTWTEYCTPTGRFVGKVTCVWFRCGLLYLVKEHEAGMMSKKDCGQWRMIVGASYKLGWANVSNYILFLPKLCVSHQNLNFKGRSEMTTGR